MRPWRGDGRQVQIGHLHSFHDGLPDMRVEALHALPDGRLWIGTHDRGAVCYDGLRFQAHTHEDGLPGNRVFAVQTDPSGSTWFGTDQGVCVLQAGASRSITVDGRCVLWGSCVDLAGAVWFGLEGGTGLPAALLRCAGMQSELITLGEGQVDSEEAIHALVCDPLGRVWAGGSGLYRQSAGGAFSAVPGPATGFRSISAMLWHGPQELWVAADTGLYTWREGRWEELFAPRGAGVTGLLAGRRGQRWVTTYEGLLLRWMGNGFQTVGDLASVLRGSLAEDPVGRIWVGTHGMGLYCLDPERFWLCQRADGAVCPAYAVTATSGGEIWAGTDRGPAHAVDGVLQPLAEERRLTPYRTTALAAAPDGLVWAGTQVGYLFALRAGLPVLCCPLPELEKCSITALAVGPDGRVWFCSRHGRAFGWWRAGKVRVWSTRDGGDHPDWIGSLAVDRRGVVWLGSARPGPQGGLWRADGQGFRRVPGTGSSPVAALAILTDGTVCAGTADGVVLLHPDGRSVRLTQAEGLSCDLVTSLGAARDGRLLIGTLGGGLCQYDGQVIQQVEMPGNAGCNVIHGVAEGVDGTIWAASEGGLLRYVPRRLAPAVEITAVVANRSYAPADGMEVTAPAGRLRVEFQGRSRQESSSVLLYRCRLKGHESRWSCTRERSVEYTDLKPGEYSVELQAVDRDLNYSAVAQVRLVLVDDPRVAGLTEALSTTAARGHFIGGSAALRRTIQQLQEVAGTDLTVLIQGETGTGKGLAARAVHEASARRGGPLIQVNCGGLQPQLIESELFGHERGAFTGAVARRLGKFELAAGGTILLDEIGDLPADCQARLLHVLQDRVIERVGGEDSIAVNVRVLAATNRDLLRAVREGQFRADLYYRLNVFPLVVPPLRERREDVEPLARHFIAQFSQHLHRAAPELTAAALACLLQYEWPGNVRELEHAMHRAVILCPGDRLEPTHVALGPPPGPAAPSGADDIVPLEEYERRYLRRVLEHTGGVIHGPRGAAVLLGIKPTTLRSRLVKLGLR